MATNMEKVNKEIERWGIIDINILADLSGVSRTAIYKLAKQGNAVFYIKGGAVIPNVPELVKGDSSKDGKKTKGTVKTAETSIETKEVKVECEKFHVPEGFEGLEVIFSERLIDKADEIWSGEDNQNQITVLLTKLTKKETLTANQLLVITQFFAAGYSVVSEEENKNEEKH